MRSRFGTQSPFSTQAADRERLYDAVLELLQHTAETQGPLLLVLDDVHWFDEASVGLLHYLARALGTSKVGFALAARKAELADNPTAQRLLRALGKAQLLRTVDLGPMSVDELQQLVCSQVPAEGIASVRPGADPLPDALTRSLNEATGNPLFALEAARALASGSEELTGSLSSWLTERMERLREQERALLAWAGALGRSFDVDVLARVTGLQTSELLPSLERLEEHAILRGKSSGYDFAHDVWRQAAYRQMSSPRQRLVHAQIAKALSQAPDHDDALAGEIAHHAALCGDAELAARACITAGRRCLRLFAASEGRNLSQRGYQLASGLPETVRVPILVELLSIQVLSETRVDLVATLLDLAERACWHTFGVSCKSRRNSCSER